MADCFFMIILFLLNVFFTKFIDFEGKRAIAPATALNMRLSKFGHRIGFKPVNSVSKFYTNMRYLQDNYFEMYDADNMRLCHVEKTSNIGNCQDSKDIWEYTLIRNDIFPIYMLKSPNFDQNGNQYCLFYEPNHASTILQPCDDLNVGQHFVVDEVIDETTDLPTLISLATNNIYDYVPTVPDLAAAEAFNQLLQTAEVVDIEKLSNTTVSSKNFPKLLCKSLCPDTPMSPFKTLPRPTPRLLKKIKKLPRVLKNIFKPEITLVEKPASFIPIHKEITCSAKLINPKPKKVVKPPVDVTVTIPQIFTEPTENIPLDTNYKQGHINGIISRPMPEQEKEPEKLQKCAIPKQIHQDPIPLYLPEPLQTKVDPVPVVPVVCTACVDTTVTNPVKPIVKQIIKPIYVSQAVKAPKKQIITVRDCEVVTPKVLMTQPVLRV